MVHFGVRKIRSETTEEEEPIHIRDFSSKSESNEKNDAPLIAVIIAVAVVIEHGYRGVNAAYVARDIYDEYFSLKNGGIESGKDKPNMEFFGELLP